MSSSKITQNAVLNVLREESPLAYKEIAQRLEVCRQTVSYAVRELVLEEKVKVKPMGCARLVYATKTRAQARNAISG